MAGAPPPGNRGLGCAETSPQQSQTSSAAKLSQLIRFEGIPNSYTRCPNHTNVALDAGHASVTQEFAKKTNLRNMTSLPLQARAGPIRRTIPHVCLIEADMRRHQ